MAAKRLPPAAYLRQRLNYDPETGVLTWRARPREHFDADHVWRRWNTKYAGKEAGSLKRSGYIIVTIDDVSYTAQRLIWVIQTDEEPKAFVDHRDGNKSDNRWENLREATVQQNKWNSKEQRRKIDLPRGVYQVPSGRYVVLIRRDNAPVYLGTFDTVEEAKETAIVYTASHRGEFIRIPQ